MKVRALKKRTGPRLRRVILRRKWGRAWSDFATEMADVLLPKPAQWDAALRQIVRSVIAPIAACVRADLGGQVFGGSVGGATTPGFALQGGALDPVWPSSRP